MELFKCILLLSLLNIAWGSSIIKVKSSNRAVANISDNNLFVESGDMFLLEQGVKKCLVRALREKRGLLLISTEECDFKIGEGDQLTYMTSFEKRGEVRGVASRKNSGNKARKLENSSSFYFGVSFVKNPDVEYDEFKSSSKEINQDALDDIEYDSEYKSLYGVSFGYSKFLRGLFYDFRFELSLKRVWGKEDADTSIRPISLIGNLGFFHPVGPGVYLKYFVGAGLSSFNYEERGFEVNSSGGGLFQLGVGVIYQNITFDIIVRSIAGSIEGDLKASYSSYLKNNAPLEVDYLMSETCFKVGFLF